MLNSNGLKSLESEGYDFNEAFQKTCELSSLLICKEFCVK